MLKIEVGSQVKLITTQQIGVVIEIKERHGQTLYKVLVDGMTKAMQSKFFELYENEEALIYKELEEARYGNLLDYEVFQTWTRLKKPYEGNIYSYLNSKTVFNPFQFKPLLKFLQGQSMERLFIADEVGVGKTIESGIIITEMLARKKIRWEKPVIVVCPNILGPKWQKEMRDRFNLTFQLHNKESFKLLLNNIQTNQLQPHQMFHIVSMQMLRSEEMLEQLDELNSQQQEAVWSLAIIDEAHHMRNAGTNSNRLGHLVSTLSEMLIMLSATPLNLKDEDLFQLMHILNPYLYPDIQSFSALIEPVKMLNRFIQNLLLNDTAHFSKMKTQMLEIDKKMNGFFMKHEHMQNLMDKLNQEEALKPKELAQYERILKLFNPLEVSFTRTLKKEAFEQLVIRDAIKVPVELTPQENEVYEEIIKFATEQYQFSGGNLTALGFVTNLPRRMATSCLPAMKEYLNKGLLVNSSYNNDTFEEVEDDADLEFIQLPEHLKTYSNEICKKIDALSTDSKYEKLHSTIKQLFNVLDNKQIIIFSFFTKTIDYLRKRLEADGFSVGAITGKTPLANTQSQLGRYEIIEEFKQKKFDVLLASDVGGEGLDFQFCQAMLNYDLPYNPMKVEQRIGRIDRFGQQAEKVFIANMYLANTVDERIYELLYERVNLIHESIGMFEPIIGKEIEDLQQDLIKGTLTETQQQEKVKTLMLAVEKAKLEKEQFDLQRSDLYGDDSFNSIISGLVKQNDFLTPKDSANITAIFLTLNNIEFEWLDEQRIQFIMPATITERLNTFLRKPGNEGHLEEMATILKRKKQIFQFNGSSYNELTDVFIPITGLWIRFVLTELENMAALYRVFRFAVSSDAINLQAGKYCLPIFNIEVSGVHELNHLAIVPVCQDSGEAINVEYLEFSKQFSNFIEIENKGIHFFTHDEAIEEGQFVIEEFMSNYLEELQFEQSILIETRIQAIELGSRTRVSRLEQTLNNYLVSGRADDRYLRMLNGQIENEKNRAKEKILSLKSNQQIAYTTQLIGLIELIVKGE
ncbi:DEAD/DEAH box helicase [Kurthia sp. Dielmo]|uniref:DEAD/DEAH box helicase n=1 Tax=Kurthia sp. Dielmo TaxID=1033738 RepID=UPI001124AB41|nr:helicase-related protein [Kurthia sp. Dielmo]